MTISTAKMPHNPIPPVQKIQWTNPDGFLTIPATQVIQQLWALLTSINTIVPCTVTGTANAIQLTQFPTPPSFVFPQDQYVDYMVFSFVAGANSTAAVTAQFAAFGFLKVFKTNGSAQAGSGDITTGLFYTLWYVDTLDSGNGGLVLK